MITVSTVRQPLARVRRQQQEQRLGRGDQDVGRLRAGSARARWPACRRCGCAIAGVVHRDALRLRDVGDAGQRRAQVALDVDRQRLERRDVEHAAALLGRRRRLEHQPVEAPEKRGQRLAAAGRREDQRGLAARDRRPSELLRLASARETRGEPLAHGGVKQVERLRAGHPAFLPARYTVVRVTSPDVCRDSRGRSGIMAGPSQSTHTPPTNHYPRIASDTWEMLAKDSSTLRLESRSGWTSASRSGAGRACPCAAIRNCCGRWNRCDSRALNWGASSKPRRTTRAGSSSRARSRNWISA